MSQLSVVSDDQLPSPIAGDLRDALDGLASALWSNSLPAERAPTPALRVRLEGRAAALATWFGPVGETRVRVMCGALLAVLPVQGSKGDAADAGRIQGLYARALRDVPGFALRAACATALSRGVGSRRFAPTPAELRAEADREAHWLRVEAETIRRVLAARIDPPRASDEVRRAAAAAARRAFGIPEPAFGEGQRPHVASDASNALGSIGRDVLERVSEDRWRGNADPCER